MPMNAVLLFSILSTLPAAVASRPAEPEAPGAIGGVSVAAIWQVANFLPPGALESDPVFTKQGLSFAGMATPVAYHPTTGAPLFTMEWTMSELADVPEGLAQHFAVPHGTTVMVVGRFIQNSRDCGGLPCWTAGSPDVAGPWSVTIGKTVETYTAVKQEGRKIVAQDLGLKTDGRFVVATTLQDQVFEALGWRGKPSTRSLTLPADPQ